MATKVEKILTSLGYRKPTRDANRMVKPIGHLVLIYWLETNLLGYYFLGTGTKVGLICWETGEIDPDNALTEIIFFEDYKRPAACTGRHADFSFTTAEQQIEEALNG